MKIGILTYHNSRNFGANLQTLASQELLRRAGFDPVVINYVDRAKLDAFRSLVPPEQIAMHEAFAARYYTLSPKISDPQEVAAYCRDTLDGVISGSDAVFRLRAPLAPKEVARRLIGRKNAYADFSWDDRLPPYFLPFEAPGLVKGALAASARGTAFYFLRPSVMRQAGRALRGFDFVTVRDEWTAMLVRWLSAGCVTPIYSPDPVFGLNRAFNIPADEVPQRDLSRTILLTGHFDRGWLTRMVAAIHARGYRAAMLANPAEQHGADAVDDVLSLPMSPLTWYSALANCAGFIGMRFHAFVSCLANDTPVVTMDVARPRLRKVDPRNPNYDLARRAGIEAAYFTRSVLMATPPDTVLDRLFDPSIRAKARAFSRTAPDLLEGHLARLRPSLARAAA
ncbi:MAG: polysaccharide pyruvyl transferase family protein [Pseudomonadota bacterium]